MTTPLRNEKCPCGSGKKYKRCCGSVSSGKTASLAMPSSIASVVSSEPHRSIAELIEVSYQYLQAEQVAEAEACCKQVLRMDEHNANALYLLGLAARMRGSHPTSADYLEKAVSIDGTDPWKFFNFAIVLATLGRFDAVTENFRKSLDSATWDVKKQLVPKIAGFIRQDIAQAPERHDFHQGLIALVTSSPFRVRIESASACNLRCQHCPTGVSYGNASRAIMKPEVFERVLSEIKRTPSIVSCVMYLGGEPLLNKNLPLMCRRIKAETAVSELHFNTNGMLLTEEICSQLATANIDRIFISIDGRSPEENDAVRIGSDYGKIVANVAMLRRHLKDAQTTLFIGNTIIKRKGDPDAPDTPDFIARDFPGLVAQTDYAMKWPKLDIKNSTISDISTEVGAAPGFCMLPMTEISIRPNGDTVLCCYDLDGSSVMGNICNTSLMEIWNGKPYRDLRYAIFKGDSDSLHPLCQECSIYTGQRLLVSPLDQ